MKSIFTLLSLISCCNVFASLAIYEKLNVEEEAVSAPRIYLKYKKEVGGLTCFRINSFGANLFECILSEENVDGKLIYDALNVAEQTTADARLYRSYQKSVGELTCYKRISLRGETLYDCSLEESVK